MLQELTKDKELGGINESLDVDLEYIKGREKEVIVRDENGLAIIDEETGKPVEKIVRQSGLEALVDDLGETGDMVTSIPRALNPKKVMEYKAYAEENEDEDDFAHEKAAWDYGEYVGNESVAVILRTASELFIQFPKFTAEDAYSRVTKGEKGKYQPWKFPGNGKDGGFKDTQDDINNTKNGAKRVPIRLKSDTQGIIYNGRK